MLWSVSEVPLRGTVMHGHDMILLVLLRTLTLLETVQWLVRPNLLMYFFIFCHHLIPMIQL